jgi:F0F1-type ATP synthase assembly protein I
MPRAANPNTQKLLAGMGDGFGWAIELVTATGVWAAIGFGLDRLFGTWPILFAIGAVVGNMTGIYILYKRSTDMAEKAEQERRDRRRSGMGRA